MSKEPMDIVHDFRSLAEENENQGNGTAAAVYRDAANHVKRELVNDAD